MHSMLSQEQFIELSQEGNFVPLWQELPADLTTPLLAYLKLRSQGVSYLMESVKQKGESSRFSILGVASEIFYQAECGYSGLENDIFEDLKEKIADFKPVLPPQLGRFWAGLVGYIGYDAVRGIEVLPQVNEDPLALPEAILLQCPVTVIFDHALQKMFVVVASYLGSHDREYLEGVYRQAVGKLKETIELLKKPFDRGELSLPESETQPVKSSIEPKEFEEMVVKAQEYIAQGDIFQVVLSQRLEQKVAVDAVALYRALRITNPSPYMFLMEFSDFSLIGASPELLVQSQQGVAKNRPIAGTRPRGENEEQDQALAQDLMSDPKELAEHVMLVDLARNDLGRVCNYGSVKMTQQMKVELYSHVMHIVSEVEGRLQEGMTGLDLLRASFPAGTVSGAPKIRAMEIIEELEPYRRGPYAGGMGFLSFTGDFDFCIMIRTMIQKGEKLYFQAGAGIVENSQPLKEYEETIHKMQALIEAAKLAQGDYLQ